MKVKAFITHKLSERYSECQDRFAINIDRCSVAVSDGMSQSIFPDYWADVLSRFYADNGHCTDEDRVKLCQEWKNRVDVYLEKEKQEGRNPWRLQNSLASFNGAGATICGVTFDKSNHWIGHVLGDSCIIEVDTTDCDQPKVVKVHTSEKKPFDSYPDYYESFPSKSGRGTIESFEGSLTDSNALLLVSDPFSEFLSKNKDSSVWLKRIFALNSHEEFCSLVDDWRNVGLHNDDSTLCIIEYDSKGTLSVEHEDKISDLIEFSEQKAIEEQAVVEPQVLAEIQEDSKEENTSLEENVGNTNTEDTPQSLLIEKKPAVIPTNIPKNEDGIIIPGDDFKYKVQKIADNSEEQNTEIKLDDDFEKSIQRVEEKMNELIENILKSITNKQNKSPLKKHRSPSISSNSNQFFNILKNELKVFRSEMLNEIIIIYQEYKKN